MDQSTTIHCRENKILLILVFCDYNFTFSQSKRPKTRFYKPRTQIRMSKVILPVTVKQEMDELPSNSEDSALNSGEAMISGNGRKRDRTAVRMEDAQMIKRQKELQDPCDPMLDNCFPKDVSTLLKVEPKESSAPVLPKDLQEKSDNVFSSQNSESDDESDDEFDPWAEIFANTYDSSRGLGRESTPPQSSVEGVCLTWAERYLSSV